MLRLSAILVLALCLGSNYAAEPKPNAPPIFLAQVANGTSAVGSISKLKDGFALDLGEPNSAVAAGELLTLRRADKPRPAKPGTSFVLLTNGDAIRFHTISKATDLAIQFEAQFGESPVTRPFSVPLPAIARIQFNAGNSNENDAALKSDSLQLANGDTLRGTLEVIETEGLGRIRFRSKDAKEPQFYPLAGIASIAFDPSLARNKKPKGAYARIVTTDGSRITLTSAVSDGKTLEAVALHGSKFQFPLIQLIGLDIFQSKATYLSEQKPKAETMEPFGGVAWPPQDDRSAKGQAIRLKTSLGEEVFDKGLGFHSKTTRTYDLGGKYKRFETLVGLDSISGRKGAVDIRILVDGKEIPIAGLKGFDFAAGVKSLNVDVTNAKELTLIVDFGPNGDVQDDVNFADARLVEE